jgi:hypothetical protein
MTFMLAAFLRDIMKITKRRWISKFLANLQIFSKFGLSLETQRYEARINSNEWARISSWT